ncbi:MAG: hypothetical protein VKJ64_12625 [Leptolyngbyaceae bacterium]|nr:hypothetical protein [Leptolyngbyaceae bacterium]
MERVVTPHSIAIHCNCQWQQRQVLSGKESGISNSLPRLQFFEMRSVSLSN